ncbi:uncharacterized protein [Cherax quadricarinatus]|uniref:uncharacterized protein n=1 Tax=Cherax quadricarinatus TaxID=27406 RepID=UPI00387E3249
MTQVMVTVVVMVVVMVMMVSGEMGERDKRFVFINTAAPITLGFMLNMPFSLILPTIDHSDFDGRSLHLGTLMGEDLMAEDLEWDAAYEDALTRLFLYFDHLQLPVLSCQERLICELTADPDTFLPVSQVFMKELRLVNGPVSMTNDSLMWRYMSAARQGFTSPIGNCSLLYPKCPVRAQDVIDMSVLKVWQYISTKVNIHFY